MIKKPILNKNKLQNIVNDLKTPFVIYDEAPIRQNMRKLQKAFSWNKGFKNYFALKACPNPSILKILHEEGSGVDASSLGELIMSEKCGLNGEEIMFTSNNTKKEEFEECNKIGAIINFDDITHIPFYMENVEKVPEIACCRYNPGELKEGNDIIGKPTEAKYGMRKDQIISAYKQLKELGVKRFGLHTMVASNELNPDYFIETARILFELINEIENSLKIDFEFINIGGGIGIPYKPEEKKVDLEYVSKGLKEKYDAIFGNKRNKQIKIFMECGRMITGPYGELYTKVIHKTEKYKKFIGVDASMQCLMRPALYGAYHHISIIGKENEENTTLYDVTGALCENNDKFAIDRSLPNIEIGDYLAIHDAGAHGTAMGFNYNATLKPKELLLKSDGNIEIIRREETLQNYFDTIKGINGFE